mmetsp:Transcript_29515/g.33949  ORF Transcript_29515/g.33949 Transcript_29515/m.33949 type:complete len:346 (-) Transcript_29515:174-1211(-)
MPEANNDNSSYHESHSSATDVLGEKLETIYTERLRGGSKKRNEAGSTNIQPHEQHFYGTCETILKSLDGRVLNSDFITHDKSIALDHLYGMVLQSLKANTKVNKKWEFNRSLHRHFDKTFNDIFITFLHWATVPVENVALHGNETRLPLTFPFLINVTMAFRRLEMYANWLHEDGKHILEPPLDPNTMRRAEKNLKRHVQFNHDDHQQSLCWLDFMPDATAALIGFSPMEKARYYVWFIHSVMFDEKAQVNGSVLIARNMQLLPSNWIPFDFIFSIGRLYCMCSSIRVKRMVSIESSPIVMFFFWFLSPSLEKSMNDRIHRTVDNGDLIFQNLGIYDYIPRCYRL